MSSREQPKAVLASSTLGKTGTSLELAYSHACIGGCGFYGSSKQNGLCSKCSRSLDGFAKGITDAELIQFLLQKVGYNDAREARRELAFDTIYPDAAFRGSTLEVPGVHTWQTTRRPLTQYDAVPISGDTACTFIATVTALKAVLRDEVPNTLEWAKDIEDGVNAFLACKKVSKKTDNLHRDVDEVLSYVMPVFGFQSEHTKILNFKENVVSLELSNGMTQESWKNFMPNAFPKVGIDGVVDALRSIFVSYDESEEDQPVAVVVIRPPESYVLVKGSGPQIHFRDSHRQTQHNFDNLSSLLEWVPTHPSYFRPVTNAEVGLDDMHNLVALHSIASTVKSDIASATLTVQHSEPSVAEDDRFVMVDNEQRMATLV